MKKWTKGEEGFEEALQYLASEYKGLGGGPDSESSVHASKQDIKDGYAWFWSDNSDISNLIQRSRDYILEVRDFDGMVSMKLDKRGYRGPIYAFRPDRNGSSEEEDVG